MTRNKHPAVKKRLAKAADQTVWAPFWTVAKKYGRVRVHPGRHTHVKRHWRRSHLKV